MKTLPQCEFEALRATIKSRGQARVVVFVAGLGLWAFGLIGILAWVPNPIAAVIPLLLLLATFEAVRNLQAALRKTVRRLQALEQLVIPQLDREARAVAAALEEEERDDAVRARRWLTQRSDAQF